jgi:hypothetical protein
MNPTNALATVILAVSAIVGLGGLAATIWAVGKVKGLELTVGVLGEGNEALRAEIADRDRRHAQQLKQLEDMHKANERAAAERIARLEGHNAALADGIADHIAERIASRLESALRTLGDRIATTDLGIIPDRRLGDARD